ncbi:MAG: radical SAM family heme chaperone HemW [Clostridia bacterium]|nr:radical SAM family heme chaperone HemW [Clostridia bacterium]
MKPIGLYLHIPFCLSKCPYCDFYSFTPDEHTMDAYTDALCAALPRWQEKIGCLADTLYLGGGTPSLLGPKRLEKLVTAARKSFGLTNAEITLEANPADRLYDTFAAFASAGGNRVSMGLQAGSDRALQALGRRHDLHDAEVACRDVFAAGIRRLSLDLMLATEGQTPADVRDTVATIDALGAGHASAYLLKIEPNTPFAARDLRLPDEDAAADLYLTAVEALADRGFTQYEISNFARDGEHSRHNLKYWNSEPYLGIGPAAHSFIDGRRFAYPRDIRAFLRGDEPLPEAENTAYLPENSAEEYALLRLRLTEGLTESGFAARFGSPIPTLWRQRAAKLPPSLVISDAEGMRLTPQGFLVSNAIFAQLFP